MAISVDSVYQKILALANKEQRGYVTPQEFNLFADHAQMDIFEQYFYDLEQRNRATGNDFDYADIVNNIEEKISIFEKYDVNQPILTSDGDIELEPEVYRLGTVRVGYNGSSPKRAEQIQLRDLEEYFDSPLTKASGLAGPYYTKIRKETITSITNGVKIYPFPSATNGLDIVLASYVVRPPKPNWTYVVSGGGSALYNPSATDHQNFELHGSEENNLIIKILQLVGVNIKDYNLTQIAAASEVKKIQQEKS